MYQVGQRLKGYIINDEGDKYVPIEGAYQFTTDDPEEMIQDVVIKADDGRLVYVDEQDIRYANPWAVQLLTVIKTVLDNPTSSDLADLVAW